MLNIEVTWWDVLYLLNVVGTALLVYYAYKRGENKYKTKYYACKKSHKYRLPPKQITPEEFVDILDDLNKKRHNQDIRRCVKPVKRRTNVQYAKTRQRDLYRKVLYKKGRNIRPRKPPSTLL